MKLTPATHLTRWRHTLVFSLSFFSRFFPLVRFHSASRTFLSFAWFLRTLKSLCVNRLRSLLRMRCMLLGYRFEPMTNSSTLGSAGSVMTISYDHLDVRNSKKTVWREKTRLTSPGVWLRWLQMHDAWLGMEVSVLYSKGKENGIWKWNRARLESPFPFPTQAIGRFHMTSRRPYWCSKTMKRRPYLCSKPILWELNSLLCKRFLLFSQICTHACHVSENAL